MANSELNFHLYWNSLTQYMYEPIRLFTFDQESRYDKIKSTPIYILHKHIFYNVLVRIAYKCDLTAGLLYVSHFRSDRTLSSID